MIFINLQVPYKLSLNWIKRSAINNNILSVQEWYNFLILCEQFGDKCNCVYQFQLKPQEAEFLAVNTNAALSTFEKVSENMGKMDHLLVNKKDIFVYIFIYLSI